MNASSLTTAFWDLVYPRSCAACGGAVGDSPKYFCWDCFSGLEYITERFCARCGDPVDGMVEHVFTCPLCKDYPPKFELARSAVRYRGPIKKMLHDFKYANATHLSVDLSLMLAACVGAHYGGLPMDAVTCVPLHPKKERERTYNQSGLLGMGLARELRLPYLQGCLKRVRPTDTQTNLNSAARRKNVRGAFEADKKSWLDGRRILLVDDVMTTGATVRECARALKAGGAASVHVVTVARG